MIDPESVRNKIDHEYWASKFFSFDWSYQHSDDYSVWNKWDYAYKAMSEKASTEVWTFEDEIKILEAIREKHLEVFRKEISDDFYNYLASKVNLFAEKGRKNDNKVK
jgi:hypothetical protein